MLSISSASFWQVSTSRVHSFPPSAAVSQTHLSSRDIMTSGPEHRRTFSWAHQLWHLEWLCPLTASVARSGGFVNAPHGSGLLYRLLVNSGNISKSLCMKMFSEHSGKLLLKIIGGLLWIIVMVSSPAFPRRPLDSCSSSRTLLPGFWLEPENLSRSHQSSGPYTGFQLHLGVILKYFYSFINHSMA